MPWKVIRENYPLTENSAVMQFDESIVVNHEKPESCGFTISYTSLYNALLLLHIYFLSCSIESVCLPLNIT